MRLAGQITEWGFYVCAGAAVVVAVMMAGLSWPRHRVPSHRWLPVIRGALRLITVGAVLALASAVFHALNHQWLDAAVLTGVGVYVLAVVKVDWDRVRRKLRRA